MFKLKKNHFKIYPIVFSKKKLKYETFGQKKR